MSPAKTGSDLFIVDNSEDDWKVVNYLREWCSISSRFDIATGYFEAGSLLALDGQWQALDEIRILMGDEVSKRTHKALIEGTERVKRVLDDSIEAEKIKNDFLTGVDAIVAAIKAGKCCLPLSFAIHRAASFVLGHRRSRVSGAAMRGDDAVLGLLIYRRRLWSCGRRCGRWATRQRCPRAVPVRRRRIVHMSTA